MNEFFERQNFNFQATNHSLIILLKMKIKKQKFITTCIQILAKKYNVNQKNSLFLSFNVTLIRILKL